MAMHEGDGNRQGSATIQTDETAGRPLLNDSHKIVFAPRYKFTRMVSLEKSAYPYFNISKNEVHPSAIELGETDPVAANEREKNYSLRFHMDNDARDVIHKEVMDWRDSSWSSMHLLGNEYIDSTF